MNGFDDWDMLSIGLDAYVHILLYVQTSACEGDCINDIKYNKKVT